MLIEIHVKDLINKQGFTIPYNNPPCVINTQHIVCILADEDKCCITLDDGRNIIPTESYRQILDMLID